MMNEDSALERDLPWPPWAWPTLCFLGLGAMSIDYLLSLASLFPELQLVLFDVEDHQWLRRFDLQQFAGSAPPDRP